jgi:hypothetical protein
MARTDRKGVAGKRILVSRHKIRRPRRARQRYFLESWPPKIVAWPAMPIDEAVNVPRQLHCICFPAGGASHSFAAPLDTILSPSPFFSAVIVIPPTSTRARVAPAAKAAFIARVTSCCRNVHGPRDKFLFPYESSGTGSAISGREAQ